MRIASNSTGMLAELSFWSDVEAREYCVVVVKGTFRTTAQGEMSLAEVQRPWVFADEHYGDPEKSCVRYESDFAPVKPMGEVLVVGKAVPPGGAAARQVTVRLEVQGRAKDALVVGERRWQRWLGAMSATAPLPFHEMPLTFDRAFGGLDDSLGPQKVECEEKNLLGVGFHASRSAAAVAGMPLPNIEDPTARLKGYRDRVTPWGFGVVGRNWKQRRAFAGTYDQKWLDEQLPFLPSDFDERYFMSSPSDQWFSYFNGGELIRCVHMAAAPVVAYRLPVLKVPVRFRFRDRTVDQVAACDTVIVEPDKGEAILLWRTRVLIGKKIEKFEVLVGAHPRRREDDILGETHGKPHYRSLEAAVRWSPKEKP